MVKLLLLFVCLLVLINVGHALECYQCEGETLHACGKNSPYVTKVGCGIENPLFFRFCLTRVVNDLQLKKTNVTLGCDLIANNAVLKMIPQCQVDENRYELKVCHICMWDLCAFDTSTRISSPRLITILSLMYFFNRIKL